MRTYPRTRRAPSVKAQQIAAEAYERATGGDSAANEALCLDEFAARGIPVDQIEPRVNVLTYWAWRAVGRQVRRGEHGVALLTWIVREDDKHPDANGKPRVVRFPKRATVFHISQTDPCEPEISGSVLASVSAGLLDDCTRPAADRTVANA